MEKDIDNLTKRHQEKKKKIPEAEKRYKVRTGELPIMPFFGWVKIARNLEDSFWVCCGNSEENVV